MGIDVKKNVLQVKPDGEMEEKLSTGLVAGHAYSVTKVTKVRFFCFFLIEMLQGNPLVFRHFTCDN